MSELRWALLLFGLLFVAGLVAWELRKRRTRDAERLGGSGLPGFGGRGPGPAPGGFGGWDADAAARPHEGAPTRATGGGGREEPSFSMPELPRREPVRDLPVVEIDPRAGDGPRVGDLPVIHMDGSTSAVSGAGAGSRSGAAQDLHPPHATDAAHPEREPADEDAGSVSAPREATAADPVEQASAWLADSVPGELPQSVVLDWPPEEQRRIVALRVVPRAGERFNGSALRQALVGEGFVHGELDIYHKPLGDGRALLSAASLTRPGTFDPRTIDGLLFAGLNLFAVMPGPLPPRDTVERLVLVGRTLAQRLRGEALDGRGQPLTDARVAELRREASEGAP
jgi:cell division protein ZipA